MYNKYKKTLHWQYIYIIGYERIVITGTKKQWFILDDTKKEYIMVQKLKLVWAKVNISQDDLAEILSISRQTYCQIENGNKVMSWNMYLSLIFFWFIRGNIEVNIVIGNISREVC